MKKHNESRRVFEEIKSLVTEQSNPRSERLDEMSTLEILKLINKEDKSVPLAVRKEIPKIAKAIEIVVKALKEGGRLFYVGAGTSGRLGVLDAAEIPPTFGTNPKLVQGIIAGGYKVLVRSKEGVEDKREDGYIAVKKRGVKKEDVVIGIAASRRTPFVLGALECARKIGAKTIFLICNPSTKSEVGKICDIIISPILGPEVIMGSTRMKAGTAQKLILNMISTTAMVKLGKVYGNLMVDLSAMSKKLVERGKRVLMIVTGCSYDEAGKYLRLSKGSVKVAILMIKRKFSFKEAVKRLKDSDGFLRKAIKG